MARLEASIGDRRIWGRALQSYKGAFGTGRLDDEPEHDGRLVGFIPLERERVKVIWEALRLSTTNPASAWHQIDQAEDFKIVLDSVKLSRFLVSTYWTCRVSFYFTHQGKTAEVAGVCWFGADTIADLFLAFDNLFHRFEAPSQLPPFAQNQLS